MAEKFKFLSKFDGTQGVPAVREFPVAATQTLVVGDLVILSSGKVTIAGDSAAAPLGVMAQDSDGASAGTMVKVYPILPGQVWRATADADATNHVLATSVYDINATTQTVDVGDNANGAIIILALRDSTTDIEISFTKGALF